MNKIIFDLETTSAEKDTCRIVELAIKQIDETGKVLINKSKRYNPGVPITPAAQEAHGITNEMVKDCPKFEDDAKKLRKIFEDAILIGYNIIVFDIPVLLNEFERAGVDLNLSRQVIDVMKVETALHSRTLSAVFERYTGKKLEDAHSAQADVEGTETVLEYQYKKIKKDDLNLQEILDKAGIPKEFADFSGKLKFNEEGSLYYNFGKHKGLAVLLDNDTKQYANWIINNKEFSNQVKKYLREELNKGTKKQFTHPAPHKEIESFPAIAKKNIDLFSKADDDFPF